MRLENPFALALLLLIPLLLLLKRQRTRVRRPVANLYLWRESATHDVNTFARRIRRDWLLILQAAFLAVVAFAMARPVVADNERSVVFVFDTSLSMGARQGAGTRLDLARARAARLLAQLPAGAQVRVVSTDTNTPLAGDVTASDGAAMSAMGSLRLTDGRADLSGAVDRARGFNPPPDRIYVFSDIDPARMSRASDLEWITVGGRASNAAITVLSARRSQSRPGHVQVLVTLANHGETPVDTDLMLTQDAAAVVRVPVSLRPHSSSSYVFDAADDARMLVAQIEHQDALTADNVRRLVMPQPAKIQVLLPTAPGFFLEKALAAHPELALAASALDADVVVCDGCSRLPDGTAGVLLVAPPSGPPEAVTLASLATDHPVANGLDIDGTAAILRPQPTLPQGSAVIARGGGEPALVAYETGSRRVVDVRIDLDTGPFPLGPAFPVLISNAVRWLAHRDENPTTLGAGEPLRWRIEKQPADPVVLGPDGRTLPTALNDGILSVTETGAAGIYRVQLASGERPVVVNPVVDGELNLEDTASPAPINTSGTAATDVRHRNIAGVVMLAALLLLALEWRRQLRMAT